jgi:cytochrome c-type biogenesis protein CcmH
VTRRELLARAAAGAAAIAVTGRAGRGQAPAPASPQTASPASGSGDRLYDPSVVQERGVATAGDNDPAIEELEHRLKCTCGCNLDIYTCRTTDFTCTYSPSLHKEVLALRREGKSPDGVVAAFVAKYGEQILMAPRPVGFNLAGYLVPGALISLAGATLAWVLVRRGRRPPVPAVPVTPGGAAGGADPVDLERLRRALADVED